MCSKKELTECEVSELLSALDLLTFLDSRQDAADHHSTHAHSHNASERWAVDGHDLACIFAVDIKTGANGLRLFVTGN